MTQENQDSTRENGRERLYFGIRGHSDCGYDGIKLYTDRLTYIQAVAKEDNPFKYTTRSTWLELWVNTPMTRDELIDIAYTIANPPKLKLKWLRGKLRWQ